MEPLPSSRWADLPPDLLRDVSARLHHAPDLVRFHAVCQSWRDTDHLSPPATSALLPCLLARHGSLVLRYHIDFQYDVDGDDDSSVVKYSSHPRCDLLDVPFHHDLLVNWVASADGTAVCFVTTGLRPALVDLITGAVTPLPRLPRDAWSMAHPAANSRGVVYGDGTVFLYCLKYNCWGGGGDNTNIFMAAVLRPGDDATWVVVKKSLDFWPAIVIHDVYAAYHDGKVVLCVGPGPYSSYAMTLDGDGGCEVVNWSSHLMDEHFTDHSYILESGGGLLWVTVILKHDGSDDPAACPSLSVAVDALEDSTEETGEKMRRVRKDGRSLGDRVLFLGCPYSFAMDAAQLGVAGGCAYLVFNSSEQPASATNYSASRWSSSSVVRCSLLVDDGETTCMKLLQSSAGRHEQTWTWLRPHVAVAPIHVIRDRIELRDEKKLFHYDKAGLRRPVDYLLKFMGRFTNCVKF